MHALEQLRSGALTDTRPHQSLDIQTPRRQVVDLAGNKPRS